MPAGTSSLDRHGWATVSPESEYSLVDNPRKSEIEQQLEGRGQPMLCSPENGEKQGKPESGSPDNQCGCEPVNCPRFGRHWRHKHREREEEQQQLRNSEGDRLGFFHVSAAQRCLDDLNEV